MASLPTIPTSFVPNAGSAGRRNAGADFGGVFGFAAYAVLGVAFILAGGVFFYGRILDTTRDAKDAQLAKAQAAIDSATVVGFVQLRDRLNSSQTLLANHIALSGFFEALKTLLPATVRFTVLHVSVDAAGVVKVEGSGVSRGFNALSVASASFASDGRIRDVIFSKMTINKDGSVSFGFSANLDPKLIAFSPNATMSTGSPAAVTASTTTP